MKVIDSCIIYTVFEILAFESAAVDLQCLGPIQFVKMFTVIGPTPPVHIWLLTYPLPFHVRHVRHISSQISFPLSKTDKSLTNTSNSRNKTKPHVLYVFVNKLSSEVSQSYECIQKYIIAYSNMFSTFV